MKFIQLAKSTIDELKLSAIRFPLPVLFALTMFLFALNGIYNWDLFPNEKEDRIASVIIAGFFWFGGATLFAESRKLSAVAEMAISIPIFLVLSSYIYYGHYGMAVYNFILSSLIVFVTVAPFLTSGSKDNGFYNFNREMWIGFVYATLLSILFCAGLSAIVATIHELFGLDVGNKIYSVIWSFGSAFLAPYYALSWVPRNFDSKENAFMPKGIKFILTYIVVPFGLIYLVILYAYAVKILIEWNLPVGKLSYMICGFGAVGTFAHIASYPLRENGGYMVKQFHKYFCRAFLPLIILLFLAIGVRINDYGLTESRYAILLAGVWFAATTITYIFRRDDETMKFGPAILSALLILASFGPWGAVSLSEKSQVGRLEKVLVENKVLVDGKIVKSNELISIDDRISITSITQYLAKTDKLDAIKPWFGKDSKIHTLEGRYYGNDIVEEMGIKPASHWDRNSVEDDRFDFENYENSRDNSQTEVRGYDYLTTNLYARTYPPKENCSYDCDSPKAFLEGNILIIQFADKHETKFDLLPLVTELESISNLNEVKKKLTIDIEDSAYKAKLMISNLSGNHKQNPKVTSVNLRILYKKK